MAGTAPTTLTLFFCIHTCVIDEVLLFRMQHT
jgi:hypothetical protein